MKLKIDNFDGQGPRDYSAELDSIKPPELVRKLNEPSELRFSLLATGSQFVVPVIGARVTVGRTNGQDVFTGYVVERPTHEYLRWGQTGPTYRYNVIARSDEIKLDEQRIPDRSPFVERSAGDALRQLTEDLLPGAFDTSAVCEMDALARYVCDPQLKWSQHAGAIARLARGSYRTIDESVVFEPVGKTMHVLDESSDMFSPEGLQLRCEEGLINDVTVVGMSEPSAYVKDYFEGDGLSLRFYLSQTPFTRASRTVLDEEYKDAALASTRWTVIDPRQVVSVQAGKLQVAGGTGADGQTRVQYVEQIELGGAFQLQHGDVTFNSPSDGILGGLYNGSIAQSNCVAGFRVTRSGQQSTLQAVINGALTGTSISTTAGHHYQLTTRFYALEIFRRTQTFHSSDHGSGNARGGRAVSADVRLVLEVHDIDPANPGSLVAPSIVLYDGVITGAPDFCTYGLVNSINLQVAIAFTRLLQAVDTEVRSALPQASYQTRLVGSLSDGAECLITSDPALQFFPQSVPASGELIEVRYRGHGQALARVTDPASVASHQNEADNGIRGVVLDVKAPQPRTAQDCENAALAILDDGGGEGWSGRYQTWSDFLPDGADVFPGDAIQLKAASRGADFTAVVRQVQIQVRDLDGEHSRYTLDFADDAAVPLAFQFAGGRVTDLSKLTVQTTDQVGSAFLPALTGAEITDTTSTTVTIDAGLTPPAGWGIEVRRSDLGWNPGNDRNLVGRFSARSFTVPRLSRVQDYFLRQYDASSPARYSRYSAALHLDRPLS